MKKRCSVAYNSDRNQMKEERLQQFLSQPEYQLSEPCHTAQVKEQSTSEDQQEFEISVENPEYERDVIGKHFPGNSEFKCQKRSPELVEAVKRKGAWSKQEDKILMDAVYSFGTFEKRWNLIANNLPGRTRTQCWHRWRYTVDPELKKSQWTASEDEVLMKAHKKLGNRWARIAQLLPGRPANSIKGRCLSLLKKSEPELSRRRPGGKLFSASTSIGLGPTDTARTGGKSKADEKSQPSSVGQTEEKGSLVISMLSTSRLGSPSSATPIHCNSTVGGVDEADEMFERPSGSTVLTECGSATMTTSSASSPSEEDEMVELSSVMGSSQRSGSMMLSTSPPSAAAEAVAFSTGPVAAEPLSQLTAAEVVIKEERIEPVNDEDDLPDLLLAHMQRLKRRNEWDVRLDKEGAHILIWAPFIQCIVERAVYATYDGCDLKVIVLSKILPTGHKVYSNNFLKPSVALSKKTVPNFACALICALKAVQSYNLCVGIDDSNFVKEWLTQKNGLLEEEVENYVEIENAFRTDDCEYLISRRTRCIPCDRYLEFLQKRENQRPVKLTIPLKNVNENRGGQLETDILFCSRKATVQSQAPEITYHRDRIAKLLEKESVVVDRDLAQDLESSFDDARGFVKVLWDEQRKANALKKTPPIKWHPTLLRWALKRKSSIGERERGFIRLPSKRTLYEYAKSTEDIEEEVIKRLGDIVIRFDDDFKKYHVIVFDVVHMLKNVVYHQGNAEITGYVNLEQVENEIAQLEKEASEEEKSSNLPTVGTPMLTYLVKGVASDVRGVVACFRSCDLNVDKLYSRTWLVISKLEIAAIKIIALVGNGSSLHQAFFNSHSAITITDSGVVFDTLNICSAEGRPIFFLNDVRLLLKLVRNCFANSGAHKNTRLLIRNGEFITWQTIISIFKLDNCSDVRYCRELSDLHVFLNSYSVLDVSVAAQVMSRTVAAFLEQCHIPNTKETVKFICLVSDFHDCLSGEWNSQAEEAKNGKLAAYRDVKDPRFAFLIKFLNYLNKWEREVDALYISESDKQKRKLSIQTLTGIERTVRAFIATVKCLLKKRTDPKGSIRASVFQHDPKEYYDDQQMQSGD